MVYKRNKYTVFSIGLTSRFRSGSCSVCDFKVTERNLDFTLESDHFMYRGRTTYVKGRSIFTSTPSLKSRCRGYRFGHC